MPYSANIRYQGIFNPAEGETQRSHTIFAGDIPTLVRESCDWAIDIACESYSPVTITDLHVMTYNEGQD